MSRHKKKLKPASKAGTAKKSGGTPKNLTLSNLSEAPALNIEATLLPLEPLSFNEVGATILGITPSESNSSELKDIPSLEKVAAIVPASFRSYDAEEVLFDPALIRLEQLHRFAQRQKFITLMDWGSYTLEDLKQPLSKLCSRNVAHIVFQIQGNRIVTNINDQTFTGISLWELGNQSLTQNENFEQITFLGLKETSTAGTFELLLG